MTITSDHRNDLRSEYDLPDLDAGTTRAWKALRAVRAAAVAEFRQHGYLGSSVDAIASRAGISKPTVYAHLGTKERLFLDAIGDALLSAYDGLAPVGEWSDSDTAQAALSTFLLHWSQRLLDPATLGLRRIVIGEAERFPQLARLWARTNASYGDGPLHQALAAMAQAGLLDLPDGDLPLQQLVAMSIGAPQLVATFRADEFDPSGLPEITTSAVTVFWAHYGRSTR